MNKVFVLFFLVMVGGVAFAQTSNEATVQVNSAPVVQATDWTKSDKNGKRRFKYSPQGNYIDYSYKSICKNDDTGVDSKVKCKTELVGMSFDFKEQYEDGLFCEIMAIYGKGHGNLKITLKSGEEKKLKLDNTQLSELKTKIGILIPLS
jgi:hypothetical protein